MTHKFHSLPHVITQCLLPVVCWEVVLSSLEERRPGLPVLRLEGGPGGQYTWDEGY